MTMEQLSTAKLGGRPRTSPKSNVRVSVQTTADAEAIGRVRWIRLRNGLLLHASDAEHLCDQRHEAVVQPGFCIYLFFEESDGIDVSVGGRPLPIGRHRGGGERPIGFTMCRREPVKFVRQAASGSRVRKICLVLSLDWFDETFGPNSSALPSSAGQHLAISRWFPSYRLSHLASELFDDDNFSTVGRLRDETIALEMVSEALSTIRPPSALGGLRNDMMVVNKARDIIDANLNEGISITELAGEVGVGASTLRRVFQQAYGCSIHRYQHDRRLDGARILIENGRSISSAANAAGYSNAANFATAFKRRFGITPSHAREG